MENIRSIPDDIRSPHMGDVRSEPDVLRFTNIGDVTSIPDVVRSPHTEMKDLYQTIVYFHTWKKSDL